MSNAIEPASLMEILPGDSPESRVTKAAHVVPTPRQMAYHQREFIAFIHWGPNAFSGREWGSGKEQASLFNPSDLDTDQWCRLMKAAGMRLVVMVVKHHDGYCLWQTRYTRHGVMSSPWENSRGDVLRALAASCKKYDLQLGVYLSPADLYQIESPEGLYGNGSTYSERVIPRPVDGRPFKDPRTFTFKVDDYNEYFLNQLFELLTEYGPIHEVWFDGAHPKRKGGQTYTYAAWYALIRELVPGAVVFGKGPDVRWCGNEGGHTRSAEWNVIPLQVHPDQCDWPDLRAGDLGSREKLAGAKYLYYLPPEINTSIRHGWFYRDDEKQQVRSADDVFDIYERAVGGNGVFMLNIPPNRAGAFSPRDAAVLEEVGRRVRGTYGTSLMTGGTRQDQDGMLVVTLPEARIVNRFVIQEDVARTGQRIEKHALDAWVDGTWQEVAGGATVGYKKILRFDPVQTDRFRLRVLASRLDPVIEAVDLHFYRPRPLPVTISRGPDGRLVLAAAATEFTWNTHGAQATDTGLSVHYTLDGSEPTAASARYEGPVELPRGGRVRACSVSGSERGPVSERELGIDPAGWKVLAVSSEHAAEWSADKAFDGRPDTFWHSSWKGGDGTAPAHPHHLAIDLGRSVSIRGFTYLPRQDRRVPDSMIEAWRFETSTDGTHWETAATGEFGNLLNDPVERTVAVEPAVKARFVRLVSLRGVQGKPYAGAAELGVLAE